jgi:hypothetical protein
MKFLGLIILMGQVRKENIRDYWSTDPTISTPIFPHIYQDNFYKSERLAQTLLDRNVRVCGSVRANRGIPCDLDGESKCWKKEKSAFRRNGDIMVQVWNDKTCANDKYDP